MAQAQAAGAQPAEASFEDGFDVKFGFNRLSSEESTVASLNGTAWPWSRLTSSSSALGGFPYEQCGSDEHPCVSDEHPCTRVFDSSAVTDQEALEQALALVEKSRGMVLDHTRLVVSPEVTMEFDQMWKADLNNGLRPLWHASPMLARLLSTAAPRRALEEDDLVDLKAEHLTMLSEELRLALASCVF